MTKAIVTIAQCKVSQNEKGEVITTCINQYAGKYMSTHIQQYGGSPYLSSSQWHRGSLLLANGYIQPVKLSFDIYNNIVNCRMTDSTEVTITDPIDFYFEEKKFISVKKGGTLLSQVFHYQVVSEGRMKLLKKYRQQLKLAKQGNALNTKNTFSLDGYFETMIDYYIQVKNDLPKIFIPKKKVVYNLLSLTGSHGDVVPENEKLSEDELISLFRDYNTKQ